MTISDNISTLLAFRYCLRCTMQRQGRTQCHSAQGWRSQVGTGGTQRQQRKASTNTLLHLGHEWCGWWLTIHIWYMTTIDIEGWCNMMQLWFTAKEVHQVSATNICHLVVSFVQKTASGPHRFQLSTECRANNEKPKGGRIIHVERTSKPAVYRQHRSWSSQNVGDKLQSYTNFKGKDLKNILAISGRKAGHKPG